MNKEKLVRYEESLNVAIDIIGDNEVSDVLEELVNEIGIKITKSQNNDSNVMNKIILQMNEEDRGNGTTFDLVGDIVADWNDETGIIEVNNRTKAEWEAIAKECNLTVKFEGEHK